MSKYFCFDQRTGQYEDIVWRKVRNDPDITNVHLGERVIGQLFGPSKYDGWTAVSHAQPPELRGLRMVSGFRTRWKATEYLLDVGVRLPDPTFGAPAAHRQSGLAAVPQHALSRPASPDAR